MQALDTIKVPYALVYLTLVNDPNIKVCRFVKDLLDIVNKVTHALSTPHFLVKIAFKMLDALHLFIECRKLSRDLLN